MRKITEIILHCSATRPNWMHDAGTTAKVAEIRRWHVVERGWRDIGYHYVIDRDGTVALGRPLGQTGAHVVGRNTGTVGICLVGGHGSSAYDSFSDHFTQAQDRALRAVIADLRRKYGPLDVSGHNQFAKKSCPGFEVPKWLTGN